MSEGLIASRRGLEIVDSIREAKRWNRQCAHWARKARVSMASLRRFWQRVPLGREIFESICAAIGVSWRKIVDYDYSPSTSLNPIKYWARVPDISDFCGRTEDLNNVKKWIVNDDCRLVSIRGMAGIGKTAFAVKLVREIQTQFDYVIWYSLRPSRPLDECLTELFEFLRSNSNSDFPDMPNISALISQLIRFLNSHRCLLIFDGLETTLRSGDYAGSYQDEYRSYSELIRRVGEEQCQSCLLVTSREQTAEIDFLERRDSFVRSHNLEGLGEAARGLLKAKNLTDENQWSTLIQTYRGSPLFLKVVATTIQEMFSGSVAAFLKQNTLVTGGIDTWLDQQFNRLSDLEKNILYLLAQQREPVLYDRLVEILQVSSKELLPALESLVMRRSLIEKSASSSNSADGFTLQPVIMEYVTNLNLSRS